MLHFIMPQVKEMFTNLTGSGIILSNAKKAIEKSNLARNLTTIASFYKCLGKNVTFFEDSSCKIEVTFGKLKSMSFGSDSCKIKQYVKQRLNANEIRKVMDQSREEISPAM